jgi:hypothetical protein
MLPLRAWSKASLSSGPILSFPTAVICKALIHERQRVSGVLVYGIDGRTAGLVSAS